MLIPTTIAILAAVLLVPVSVRGQRLHNHIVAEAATIASREGWKVAVEHPLRLPDQGLDFVDLLLLREPVTFAVEVETTARYVRVNAAKAAALDLPLLVLVPNRKVGSTVRRVLDQAGYRPGGRPIQILRLGELSQVLTNCFPLISAANPFGKTGKQIDSDQGVRKD